MSAVTSCAGMNADRFTFTITDVARFLGKSAVTLRGWERQGLIDFPRDDGGDRKFTIDDVRATARIARELGRVPAQRLELIGASLTLLSYIEKENQ